MKGRWHLTFWVAVAVTVGNYQPLPFVLSEDSARRQAWASRF